jgi:GTPase
VVSAKPGENVCIKLGNNVNIEDVCKGFVLCSKPVCPAVHTVTAQLALVELLEHRPIFTAGYTRGAARTSVDGLGARRGRAPKGDIAASTRAEGGRPK